MNTTGLRDTLSQLDWTDSRLADDLLAGLHLVGDLPWTGLWEQKRSLSAAITKDALINQAKQLRHELIESSQAKALPAHQRHVRKTLWEQTKEDIRAGIIGKPRKASAPAERIHKPLTRRFGREQFSSKGQKKIRCIDDFSASLINSAVGVPETLHHEHVDDLAQLLEKLGTRGHRPQLLKADFHKAYRSVPVHPDDSPLADILVYDTDNCRWVIAQQRALPFGAVAAVYGWERVGSALTGIIRQRIGIPFLRYVDDLFTALPPMLAQQARVSLEEILDCLGFALAPEKTEGPSDSLTILGVQVVIEDKQARFFPEPAKAARWITDIKAALNDNSLSPGEANKLAGRLNFASSTTFGRVGMAHIRPLYHRAHGRRGSSGRKLYQLHLDTPIKKALRWWLHLLQHRHLEATVHFTRQHTDTHILYTDATGDGHLGSALYDTEARCLGWSAGQTPQWMHHRLHKRKTQINAHELIAAHWGLEDFSDTIRGSTVHLYVDNTAAEHIARKGSSKSADLNQIAGSLWLLAAELHIHLHLHRVPSKSNPSDAPSRGTTPPLASEDLRHHGIRCRIKLRW